MTVTVSKPAINIREALKRGVSMYGLQIATALHGGALNDVSIGGRTPAAGAFTSLAVDTDTLFVDEVNGRVGIGTNIPVRTMHVFDAVTDAIAFFESGDAAAEFAMADTGGSVSFRTLVGQLRISTGGDASTASENSTEALRIDANGALLHGTTVAGSAGAGDIVVNGGIFLGGSAAANELNDYEEGTWTPVLSDGTNADATYLAQVGHYTKVGNKVHVQGRVRLSALGTVSGAVRLTGLPFVTHNAADGEASVSVSHANGISVIAGVSLSGYITNNTSYITLTSWDLVTGTSNLGSSEFTAGGDLTFSAEYIAA